MSALHLPNIMPRADSERAGEATFLRRLGSRPVILLVSLRVFSVNDGFGGRAYPERLHVVSYMA